MELDSSLMSVLSMTKQNKIISYVRRDSEDSRCKRSMSRSKVVSYPNYSNYSNYASYTSYKKRKSWKIFDKLGEK